MDYVRVYVSKQTGQISHVHVQDGPFPPHDAVASDKELYEVHEMEVERYPDEGFKRARHFIDNLEVDPATKKIRWKNNFPARDLKKIHHKRIRPNLA